ncbi:hypothetical protein NE237_017857 [Protea cynaroides]|uniref:Uncharacterized protein n=1 Tax=Protea cynaroides TaxID=273540 RepID=A0A9Q0K8T4_9MAGN|nr:hypothetical protein NE237_017857 [Protea cynaroides]
MGKKISKKKTKEIREVVAEASSASIVEGEVSEQQTQPRRKRGRPRKIIENTQVTAEGEDEKNLAEDQKEAAAEEESDSKRMKSGEEEKHEKGGTGPSEESKTKEPPKRGGRRKSQPRKSS